MRSTAASALAHKLFFCFCFSNMVFKRYRSQCFTSVLTAGSQPSSKETSIWRGGCTPEPPRPGTSFLLMEFFIWHIHLKFTSIEPLQLPLWGLRFFYLFFFKGCINHLLGFMCLLYCSRQNIFWQHHEWPLGENLHVHPLLILPL